MTKKGRIGNDERTRIVSYLTSESNEQIAERFDRTLDSISRIRDDNEAAEKFPQPDNEYIAVLHTRHFWATVQRQLLNSSEIVYFEQSWAALYEQYVGSEIKHTDEMMIKDLIMLDVLLNRTLEDRRNVSSEVDNIKGMLEDAHRIEHEPQRIERVSTLGRTLSQLVSTQETSNKVSNDIQAKKDKKFEQLKATRDQRFKTAEQSKTNFFQLIIKLDEDKSRKEQGRKNELIKLSAAKYQADLEKLHQFEDGEVARPILTPESVLRDSDESEQEEVSGDTDK